jgi:hypothetical protein
LVHPNQDKEISTKDGLILSVKTWSVEVWVHWLLMPRFEYICYMEYMEILYQIRTRMFQYWNCSLSTCLSLSIASHNSIAGCNLPLMRSWQPKTCLIFSK